MRRSQKLSICLWVLLVSLPSVFGQQGSGCFQTVIVGIVNEQGAVPRDLTSRNFNLTDGKRPARSLITAYSEGPRRVMVLLDSSGSMLGPEAKQHPKWQIARAAAQRLIASLPSSSAAGLMTFTDKVESRAPLSVDHRLAEEWLDSKATDQGTSVKGRTAMYAAIEAAEKQLEPTQPGDAIYIITDAGENASNMRASDVEKSLLTRGVRVFAFLLVSLEPRMEPETEGTDYLQRLVINSGGFTQAIWPNDARRGTLTQGVPSIALTMQPPVVSGLIFDNPTQEQIQLHTNLLSHWISAYYLLTFQPLDGKDKPQHITITVVDSLGHSRRDLTLAYPHALLPCATTSSH